MRTARCYSSILSKLILLALFTIAKVGSAQNNPTYSNEKEVFRVVAIKDDLNRIESVSNTIELERPTTIYMPNAFTPDHDGSNDQFGAVGINVEEYHLKIFNRWGELIFESSDIAYKWDGTHKGQLVPDGVYVYTLFAKELVTGKRISKTGTVTILL
jgi:gliding motility-associated-like protein